MSASTGSRWGVARKPVARWVSAARIRSTSRAADRCAQLAREQVEGERADVVGLRVGAQAPVGAEELGLPGGASRSPASSP